MHKRKKKETTLPLSSNLAKRLPLPIMPSNFLRTANLFTLNFKSFLLILSLLLNVYLLLYRWHSFVPPSTAISLDTASPTTRHHIVFAIASSSLSWPKRKHYVHHWYSPNSTRAFAFLDAPVVNASSSLSDVPPVVISADTSKFPYTFKRGLPSAIRVARVVKEVVDRNESDVRWFVFGDDDTVFFVDNLVETLSKYDHNSWFYIGSNSESYEQNVKYSFDMAFGGGGFAISHSLARVLARVLDSCLRRYGHLYGSDARIYSCVAELGVGLTHEPGFHQVDMRGNLFGMLAAHPLSPLLSLHHLDILEPLFPDMNRTQALEHLFAAANVDPARILQQTVCYDQSNSLTFSVSWGFAVQVSQGNELLPNLLSVQRSFTPWSRGSNVNAHFMYNLRDYPRDPCRRPSVFFLESVTTNKRGIWTNYTRRVVGHCFESNPLKQLKHIGVFAKKLELDTKQMKALRRQCCNVLPSSSDSMIIHIRQCGTDELISMQY
ncbi:transferring glycosyl group transferase [Senna tora]|uniref:Transferring glycosyl group transferase n=1 Tax=Senna tora TaxID=362788 RepID=A0A834SK63_9FABA|nr:transferring glycosyl group transferase [Senna tora]